MPELPEVQTVINGLIDSNIIGRTIKKASITWDKTIAVPSVSIFKRKIKEAKITAIRRRAKYIIIELDTKAGILVHLRMTGRLHVHQAEEERSKHEHVVLELDDLRQIRLHDTRKFGRVWLTDNPDTVLGDLGPEPLEPAFTNKKFAEMFTGKSRMLKPLLLDQHFIAGLGNIYVDEALWESRLHPQQTADTLTADDIKSLRKAIRIVLKRGLRNLGTSLGRGATTFYSVAGRKGRNRDKLQVFRRQGQPCPACETEIQRIIVGQRSTHICPACQKPKAFDKRG